MNNLRLEWIEAGSLQENPHNWRRHPQEQVQALRDLVNDPNVGWAGACLYNERTQRLIDGHARRSSVDPKTPIPTLVGIGKARRIFSAMSECERRRRSPRE